MRGVADLDLVIVDPQVNQLLGLAFTGAIAKFAKERQADVDDILLPGTVAPLVVDSPFGHLDPLYRRALSLQPALEGLIVPSKFYGTAASGRPILFIGDPDGEVARLIRRHDCGWSFRPGEDEAVAALLGALAADRTALLARGQNARRMVRDHYSRSHGIAAWDALLRNVAAD